MHSTVVAVGYGEATGSPELARVGLLVEAKRQTPEQAIAEVEQKTVAVVAALRGSGVADNDIHTKALSVYRDNGTGMAYVPGLILPPVRPTPPAADGEGEAVTARLSYIATRTVALVVHDIARIASLMDKAIKTGATQSTATLYDVENPSALAEVAEQRAIANAQHNAEILARETRASLGRLLSVVEIPRASLTPFGGDEDDVAFLPTRDPVADGMPRRVRRVRLTYELAQ